MNTTSEHLLDVATIVAAKRETTLTRWRTILWRGLALQEAYLVGAIVVVLIAGRLGHWSMTWGIAAGAALILTLMWLGAAYAELRPGPRKMQWVARAWDARTSGRISMAQGSALTRGSGALTLLGAFLTLALNTSFPDLARTVAVVAIAVAGWDVLRSICGLLALRYARRVFGPTALDLVVASLADQAP